MFEGLVLFGSLKKGDMFIIPAVRVMQIEWVKVEPFSVSTVPGERLLYEALGQPIRPNTLNAAGMTKDGEPISCFLPPSYPVQPLPTPSP